MIYIARVQEIATGKVSTIKLGKQRDTQAACSAAFIKLFDVNAMEVKYSILDVYPA